MRVLDLFSGIGGFSLGLERAGMRTIQFVELDPFCRAVLGKHWPDVPCHDDIRTFHAPAGFADVICGGFPCQDISFAGDGAGLAGERSGLWSEYARLIGEARPRYVIVENVAALLSRGVARVLGDLAALGYDAEWHCIPASALGAPHQRDRLWIVAHANGTRELQPQGCIGEGWRRIGDSREAMANPDSTRLEGPGDEQSPQGYPPPRQPLLGRNGFGRQWESEPDVGRVANGVPARAHRLKSLGNAVVPAIPEMIGRAIMRHAHDM